MVFSTLGAGISFMLMILDMFFFPLNTLEGTVAHTFSPSSQEAEAAVSLSLHSETLSLKKEERYPIS